MVGGCRVCLFFLFHIALSKDKGGKSGRRVLLKFYAYKHGQTLSLPLMNGYEDENENELNVAFPFPFPLLVLRVRENTKVGTGARGAGDREYE